MQKFRLMGKIFTFLPETVFSPALRLQKHSTGKVLPSRLSVFVNIDGTFSAETQGETTWPATPFLSGFKIITTGIKFI